VPPPDKIIEGALSSIRDHFAKLGCRGILTGTPVNRMTLILPRGYELSVMVSPGQSTAVSQQSQMTTSKDPYGVLISVSRIESGSSSKSSVFGLTPTTVEKTADLIIEQIEKSCTL
jgi:hypothetical protein